MPTITVAPPYPVFNDADGSALEAGFIYIGGVGLNPLIAANQLAVYSDDALTLPIAQPIRTSSGYPINGNGSPTRINTGAADYSIVVLNRSGELIFSSLSNKTRLGLIDLSTDVTGTLLSTLIRYDITAAELAAGVPIVNYYVQPGYIERYGNNVTPGTTDMSTALSRASLQANQNGGADINATTICHIAASTTVLAKFRVSRRQCFTDTSVVVFAKGSIEEIYPEWWGDKGDAAIDGSSGTDCTAAFTAAITASTESGTGAIAIHPIRVSPGNHLVGNLIFPPATDLRGMGRHVTNFICRTGTVGKWFTDNGNAAKIIMADFAMYGVSRVGLTHGLDLGNNGIQHGTEGWVSRIWVRDCTGRLIDINGNVGLYSTLTAQNGTHCIRIQGVGNMASHLVAYAGSVNAVDLSYTAVNGMEVEAPGTGSLPIYIRRNSNIQGLTLSLAAATTFSHLVEIDIGATAWSCQLQQMSAHATAVVTNGNFKNSDGTYFGGNATAGSQDGEGMYATGIMQVGVQNGLKQGQKVAGKIRLVNTAGTIQHRMGCTSDSSALGPFLAKISGASQVLTNTPTGADGVTAMAAGLKIGSASTNAIYFDVAAQVQADFVMDQCQIAFNNTGTAYTLIPQVVNININTVIRIRMAWFLQNATTGANVAWATALAAPGNTIDIVFSGYLR